MSYGEAELEHRGITFGPPPPVFDVDPFAFGDRDPRALSDRGLCHWLTHSQTDLTGPERVFTHRSIKQATGDEGLQTVARFDIDFHPDYERVTLHAVKVHRGGLSIDGLKAGNVEILQRELNLERAVYDGRRTVHLVVPDVRVGDVVETVFSITGANPVLKDAFAWWFVLQWAVPVVETRCVVRIRSGRALAVRALSDAPPPVVSNRDGAESLEWRVVDLKPYRQQAGSPLSHAGFQAVHVADDLTWAQIADIFRPGYDVPAALPGELAETVAALREAHLDPGARMLAGLRFVQGLLRYHSVGVGDGGYRPRDLAKIWSTRYGDCKDGSLLLATVLKAMEIDATCALVNTSYGADLDRTLPNAQAFNHCIVRARIGDEVFWLDATRSVQAGSLRTLTQDDHHWALPLRAGASLEPMNTTPILTTCETTEKWRFAAGRDAPAQLKVTTLYRGWRADGVRRWIANDGPASVERQWREGLEKDVHSPLDVVSAPEIHDDAEANSLRIIETYTVKRPIAQDGQGEFRFHSRDDVVGPNIESMPPGTRTEPFELGLPRRVITTRIFEFPVPIQIEPWSAMIPGPLGQRLETSMRWEKPTIAVHTLAFTTRERTLPAEEADAYREFVAKARQNNGITFVIPFENGQISKIRHGPGWQAWAIWGGIVLALALFRWIQG